MCLFCAYYGIALATTKGSFFYIKKKYSGCYTVQILKVIACMGITVAVAALVLLAANGIYTTAFCAYYLAKWVGK